MTMEKKNVLAFVLSFTFAMSAAYSRALVYILSLASLSKLLKLRP